MSDEIGSDEIGVEFASTLKDRALKIEARKRGLKTGGGALFGPAAVFLGPRAFSVPIESERSSSLLI
jgi:hypothetical protein